MTVVTDSKQLRKAFLGFLLCAHLHEDGNDSWQKARDGVDILAKASSLSRMAAGSGAGPSSSSSRPTRGPKRTYTERDSQSSSQPSSQGMYDAVRKAAQTGEKTSYPPDPQALFLRRHPGRASLSA